MTPQRKALIEQVLDNRTRHLTLVMEDIDKPHNAGAVLRSADCFGIQDIHLVEESTGYKHSQGVTRGSVKWLSLHRYRDHAGGNAQTCLTQLKAQGYRIYVTSPAAKEEGYDHVDLSQPVAVLFGTEWAGASDDAQQHADGYLRLPMYGFTESFNISVAAALTMQALVARLRASGVNWQLTEEEKNDLRLDWYRNSVRNPSVMEQVFWKERGGKG